MVFNATFDNISVISWRSVLLVEETGVPRENHPIIRLDFDIADSVVCLGFHFIETNHECLFQIHVYDNYLLNEVPFYFTLMSIQHI
jgi:hypothetical protein